MAESEALENMEAAVYDLSESVSKLSDTVTELTEALQKAIRVAVAHG